MKIKDKTINLEESDLIVVVGEKNVGKTEAVLDFVERERGKYIDLKVTKVEDALEIINNFTEEDKLQLQDSAVVIDHVRIVAEGSPNGQTSSQVLSLMDACSDYKLLLVMEQLDDFLVFSVDEVVNL